MATLHTASTDAVPSWVLSDLRILLDGAFDTAFDTAFEAPFTDDDWDHALGGSHAWVTESSRVISHASLVERTLVCAGKTLRSRIRRGRCHFGGTPPARSRHKRYESHWRTDS